MERKGARDALRWHRCQLWVAGYRVRVGVGKATKQRVGEAPGARGTAVALMHNVVGVVGQEVAADVVEVGWVGRDGHGDDGYRGL